MELIYLHHSGYALLGEDFTLIIDFFEDTVSETEGVLHEELLKRAGNIYVLSSHAHHDHFVPHILTWKALRPDIVYLFSTDIRQRLTAPFPAHWMEKGDTWTDERLRVEAFGSTDAGISFLITIDGKHIFHAGDLNNWHWMEECGEEIWQAYERAFLLELEDLAQRTSSLDLAMFPIDPRLGAEYMRGATQFIERIQVKYFAPMHFAPNFDKANAFGAIAHAHNTVFLPIYHRGQREKIIL